MRCAFALGENRAQAFVAGRHIGQRRLQRRPIQRSRQAHRQRDIVGGARAFKLVQEPEALLGEGQRNEIRPRLRRQSQTHRSGILALQLRRQPGDGRVLEQTAQSQFHAQVRSHPADQSGRQQRMPTQFKEVVVDADAGQIQHLGEQIAQQCLAGCPGLSACDRRG